MRTSRKRMCFSSPETSSMKLLVCANASVFPSWIRYERPPSLGSDPSGKDAHHSFVRASVQQKSNIGTPNSSLREIQALNNLSCQIKWKCLQKSPSVFQLMELSFGPFSNSNTSSGVSVNNSANRSVSEIVRNCISISVFMATNLLSCMTWFIQRFLSHQLYRIGIQPKIHSRHAFVGNRNCTC